ncbi:hypothetical protein ACFC1I_03165 [Microbacterium sp. NPDC056044]|uniref:YobI family P-loop NTPase n=1 Tax=Microbacterium sp. NPDC056044 TaxID=3345690 RepID=UPI0035DADCFA
MQQLLLKALERATEKVRSWGSKEELPTPVLLPLTPKFDRTKHGVYLDIIEAALNNPAKEVRNIALTGSYGVGKSSILSEVGRLHEPKVIAVSLSSLGFPDDEPLPAGDAAKAASTKTNRIQKEIVKQLLYSQDPLKTPGSRYRRTTRFRFGRTLGLSALLSLPVALVFFLTGWTASIATLIPNASDVPWLAPLLVYVASTLLLLGLFAAFHNRFQIEKLGAGAATISLSAKSATYFDEYLDEIVYLFEVVKRDIVIFEDIDRFDDAHIFETLRSLNSILNGAKQLGGRKIRFIYAIKDSIFDELGARAAKEQASGDQENDETKRKEDPNAKAQADAAEVEIARANRTKFFDLVVPVVPFITHRSARDILVQVMGKDLQHGVSDELIDLTGRYVADMRLIKNIRNEYAIFKRQVIDSGTIELSENGLFAMVLYKSTHLADFELIKLGNSNLDLLYRDGRSLVAANIKTRNATIRTARASRPRASIGADEAKKLGKLFDEHMKRTLSHLGLGAVQTQPRTLNGEEVTDAELLTPQFWEKFATTNGTVQFNYLRPNQGRWETLHFQRADVAQALRRPIDSNEWIEQERARLDAEVADAIADRDFLTHADMSDLMARTEFTLDVDGKGLSFADLAKKHLKSELAQRLLEAGYIDRNFTLYTSTFYTDRVSANATNYILKNVDTNEIDMHFELSDEEVAAILRERGRGVLGEKSAYNLSVVRYLLASDRPGLEVVLGRLARQGDDEKELILTYLDEGANTPSFISALTPEWAAVFTFLVSESGVEERARLTLLDAAFRAMDTAVVYKTDESLRDFLVASYHSIPVFTATDVSEHIAGRVAGLVERADAYLPSLDGLGATVRAALAANGSYDITRENLLIALGDPTHSLSLDAIKSSSADVYGRVLGGVGEYLSVLAEGEPTIVEPTAFAAILEEVAETDESALQVVVERSATDCVVTALADIESTTWSALAEHGRFPVTFANVYAYIAENGLDDSLARMLEASGEIETPAGADEAPKLEVALTILRDADRLPSAKLRAELVDSLGLTTHIDVASIPREAGEFVGWLIAEDVIRDDAATFSVIGANDIDGLAFAITKSANFASFMTTAEVTPARVGALTVHARVPEAVKDTILARFTDFTVGTSRTGLSLIARYAVDNNKRLAFDEVARLAREGVDAELVVPLLGSYLPSVGIAELEPVLISLGGEFEKLSAANGRHPRVPLTSANRALVDRLEALEIASSSTEADGEIKVNMKHG